MLMLKTLVSPHPSIGLNNSELLPLKGTSILTGALELICNVRLRVLVPVVKLVAMAMSLFMKYTSKYLVTVAVELDRAGVLGIEMEAVPVGEMFPIFLPTGTHKFVVQVTRSAVPAIVNPVAGKKAAGGLVIVKLAGIRVVLVIVIVLVGEEVRERGMEMERALAGMEIVLEVLEEVSTVIVWAAVDLVVKVRRPVKRVLVVRP